MRMHFRVLAGAGAQPDSGIFQERISSEISRKLPSKNIAQTFRETNSSINLTQQIAVDVADVLSASQELFVSPLLFFCADSLADVICWLLCGEHELLHIQHGGLKKPQLYATVSSTGELAVSYVLVQLNTCCALCSMLGFKTTCFSKELVFSNSRHTRSLSSCASLGHHCSTRHVTEGDVWGRQEQRFLPRTRVTQSLVWPMPNVSQDTWR